jgi:hypothetical protein
VDEYKLSKPRPTSADAEEAANGQALAAALVALGSTQGGLKQNEFTFAPPAGTVCTDLVDQVVTIGGGGTGRAAIRGRTRTSSGVADRDVVKLRCLETP